MMAQVICGRQDMNEQWKATERAIARRLGGRRSSHRNLGLGAPDVLAGSWAVEVKHRRTLPAWLLEGMAQAQRYAGAEQLALLVLHQAGQRHAHDLVVLRLADFEHWFGDISEGEEIDDAG